jgi:hypothetical protein
MELRTHWRAEPTRSGRVLGRSNGGRMLGAAVAVGAMVAVAMPVLSSDAAVGGSRSIEVTTTTDLVILEGFPENRRVKIEAIRAGKVIAFATKRTQPGGSIELNHGGGSDCWESRRTPNLGPRDKIRTTILASGVRDTSYVRGVWLDTVAAGADSVTASGRLRLGDGPTAVNPARDILELRVRTAGGDFREDIIPSDVDPDGSWSHEISVPGGAVGAEVVLEWANPAGRELTVAEEAGPAVRLPGCPPLG